MSAADAVFDFMRLVRFRETRGLSQADAATLLNVSKNYVWMIEKGKKPGRKFVEKLSYLESGPAESNSTTGEPPAGRCPAETIGDRVKVLRARDGIGRSSVRVHSDDWFSSDETTHPLPRRQMDCCAEQIR
jgi:transcriptional regulator with XRE-family HTH domain